MSWKFNPSNYRPPVAALVQVPRLAELGPGTPNEAARPLLEKLSPETICGGRPVRDRAMAEACCAALWLYHDFLDESHRISQEIDTPTGSFWHGIMHRREPDYANAKYWFRRVGRHPVFDDLTEAARDLAHAYDLDAHARYLREGNAWDALQFVDLCESAARGRSSAVELCRQIQQREWELLFDFCWRAA